MDTNKILSADLLDLIFDDRNKEYGAYELRKTYQRRVIKSLVLTTVFIGLTCTGVVLANKFEPKQTVAFEIRQVEIESIEPKVKDPEPLPVPPPQEPPQIQTEQFSHIDIVVDEDVTDPPPTQEDLTNSKIGLSDQVGVIDEGIAALPNPDDGKGIIETPAPKEPDFTAIEIEAKFDGDWAKFLFKNLNPSVPVDNGAPVGSYTVVLQFVVDADGAVSDIKPLTNHGYGLEQEAMRVLKKAKNWEPAIQNGRKVKAYRKQPITFLVTEE